MSIEATRHGTFRVRWRDDHGKQQAKTFKRRRDAEMFERTGLIRTVPQRMEEIALLGDFRRLHAQAADEGIDPTGNYVYCLWGANPHRPIYVGCSSNIFSRLGDHFSNSSRRPLIKRVSLTRCDDAAQMLEVEATMIRHFRPDLNIRGQVPVPVAP